MWFALKAGILWIIRAVRVENESTNYSDQSDSRIQQSCDMSWTEINNEGLIDITLLPLTGEAVDILSVIFVCNLTLQTVWYFRKFTFQLKKKRYEWFLYMHVIEVVLVHDVNTHAWHFYCIELLDNTRPSENHCIFHNGDIYKIHLNAKIVALICLGNCPWSSHQTSVPQTRSQTPRHELFFYSSVVPLSLSKNPARVLGTFHRLMCFPAH